MSLLIYLYIYYSTGVDCYKPANGETVTMETKHNIPVDISLKLLKREASFAGKTSSLWLCQWGTHNMFL